MQAIVHDKYGPPEVLYIKQVQQPIPEDDQVLIRVRAATATLYDCWVRSATAPPGFGLISRIASGIRQPKKGVLGTELAGEIEAIGKDVKRFKKGDPVFALTLNMGAYAEYICLSEDGAVAIKPDNMTYKEAAAVPYGAMTAWYFLQTADIQRGQKVLIFGASGGVGNYAVQLAKSLGAEVTGVCSTAKIEMVKMLGADHVIDYTKEDFTKRGETYDVIFDTIGKSPFRGSTRSLAEGGIYLFATFGLPKLVQILWLKLTGGKKVGPLGVVEDSTEDIEFLKELIEAGKIKAVIDRCFPLEQTADAHRYVETGKKTGNVVITVPQNGKI